MYNQLGLALAALFTEETITDAQSFGIEADDTDESTYSEVAAKYSDGLSFDDEWVQEGEAEAETSALERRLKRAGIRRVDEYDTGDALTLDVTLYSTLTRKPLKVTVIRQTGGDRIVRVDQEFGEKYIALRRKWHGAKMYRVTPSSTIIINNRVKARDKKVDEVEFSTLDEKIRTDYRTQVAERDALRKLGKSSRFLDVLIRTSEQML